MSWPDTACHHLLLLLLLLLLLFADMTAGLLYSQAGSSTW
jgi:hypothetical protein